ncbi:MAG: SpoIVB peptidase S55 domain-containing protein [Armatimonadota bacterium]
MDQIYRSLTVFVIITLLIVAAGVCTAAPGFDPATMMRADGVERGMTGVGKSVFQGVEVQEFQFEIVGRMTKILYGHDIILGQITGGPPIERNAGIIGGMSGSPCYIDGKLVGALGYGWSWQKEAMFGITPIEAMLEGTWPTSQQDQATVEGLYRAQEAIDVAGRQITRAVIGSSNAAFADDHTIVLKPVLPQITCSGFSAKAMELMGEFLKPYNLEPMAGPGSMENNTPVDLQPGSAVGVRLMEGDFQTGAVGTLAYRNGASVMAFGHPMMELGPVELPFCSAYIHDIMPSIQRSGKIGSTMETVGTLFSDNPWAVGATLDKEPSMVPASFTIVDKSRDLKKSYEVKVCDQPLLTSQLISMAMMSAVEATFSPNYEGIATLHFRVTGTEGDTVQRTESFYYHSSVVMTLLSDLAFPMYLLQENRFRPQDIENVEVTAEFTRTDNTALIERVYAGETVARAGEPLHLHIVTRPDGEEAVEEVVTLDIPIDTPKGALRLAVCNGGDAWTIRSRLHLLQPTFTDLESVIDFFEKMERNDQLAVIGALPGTGLLAGDTTLWRLPGSYENLIKSSPRTDLHGGRSELSEIRQSKHVMYGVEYLGLPTADREGAKGATPKPTEPKSSNDTASVDDFLPSGAVVPITQGWAADAFSKEIATGMRRHFDLEPPPAAADLPPGLKMLLGEEDDGDSKDEKDDEESEKDEEEEKPDADRKMTARQPDVWAQTDADEFSEGKSEGVAVRSDGVVTLAPRISKIELPPEFFVLSSAADADGTLYFGTGTDGRIYRSTGDGVELYAATDGFMVTGLLMVDDTLLAATAPGGKILRIDSNKDPEEYCDLPVDYVWDIGLSAAGEVLACTGSSGQVYRIAEDGYTEVLDVSQAHVLCMAADADYTYFGSASEGVVYRLDDDGHCSALFDAKGRDITALAVAPEESEYAGSIYVATDNNGLASEGGVYRIAPDGHIIALYEDKKVAVHSLVFIEDRLYAGTGDEGKLLEITGEKRHTFVFESEDETVTCLQSAGNGRLYAGTSNIGTLHVLDASSPTSGWLESSVLDGERLTRWGRVMWQAGVEGNASAKLLTRSGNNSDPTDDSWSKWSAPLDAGETGSVFSPPARYLQYRLELDRKQPGDVAEVSGVRIAYLPANRVPEVKFSKPSAGSVITRESTVKWDADDDDDDTLLSTLKYRPLGDVEWAVLQEAKADSESFDWNTQEAGDGPYELCVEVTDRPSNPADPQSTDATLDYVIVDNSMPEVWAWDVSAQKKELVIRGVAVDEVSHVAEVTFQVGEEDTWMGAVPLDGMYDSPNELFEIRIPLPEDATEITIRAKDAGGNEKSVTITWPNTVGSQPAG